MYTTRTKMLFSQLPGSIVFEQDSQQYTTPLAWDSEAFKPLAGAQNAGYLLDRAMSLVRQHPPHLRIPYDACEPRDFELLQPAKARLHILPRAFECSLCKRLSTYKAPENVNHQDSRFSRGFYCASCKNATRFQQISLVWVHQCGALLQPYFPPCDNPAHGYRHIYIDRRGTQQPTEYRVRCMGQTGSAQKPACTSEKHIIVMGHSPKACSLAAEIKKKFTTKEALQTVDELTSQTIRLRPAQDPANFYSVGLDVVNPSIEIPQGVHTRDEIIAVLLEAHIRGDSLAEDNLREAFRAGGKADQRVAALRRMTESYEGTLSQMGQAGTSDHMKRLMWKGLTQAAGPLGQVPKTYEEALQEITSGQRAGVGVMSLLRNEHGHDREDRAQLVDQLIEVAHLQSTSSTFEGLDETADTLLGNQRESAESFLSAAKTARSLGFTDVKSSSAFDIVRMQVGYVRNSFDVSKAQLSPFTELHGRRPIYARQSSTEAVMFTLDPVRVVQWVHAAFPNGEYQKHPRIDVLSAPEARRWLLESINYQSCLGYDPIQHEPTRQVYQLIHTLSHLFMRTSSSFSGIDANTMKELLYPALPGFIIYKGQHGDFSLGGLVTLYEDHLGEWLTNVEQASRDCPNDPICRTGRMRDTVESAACYGCVTGSELSCVHFNRDLDRAVLQGTVRQRRNHSFQGFWKM